MQRTSRRLRQVLALAAAAALLAVGSALATVDPTVRVSPTASPFGGTSSGAACQGQTQTGTNYPGAEVEPFVDVNLANADNLVGAWQQDRWSNGGSTGQMSALLDRRRAELDDPADLARSEHRAGEVQPLHRRQRPERGRLRARHRPVGVVLAQRRRAADHPRHQRLERRQRRARVPLHGWRCELEGPGRHQARQPGELLQRQGDHHREPERLRFRLRHVAAHRGAEHQRERSGRRTSGRVPVDPLVCPLR